MNSITRPVEPRVPAASTGDAPFVQTWSTRLSPPQVHEMALTPGRPGQFLALNNDEILQFDSTGTRVRSASQIVEDRDGSVGGDALHDDCVPEHQMDRRDRPYRHH